MEKVKKFQTRSVSRNLDAFWYFVSMMAAVIVALIDVALGVATIAFCYYPVADFGLIRKVLDNAKMEHDAAWWGVVSIPIFALLGIWSGFKQLKCICTRTAESPQFWKFSIFFFGEALGFILPYYFISDYQKKVEIILDYGIHGQYYVFYLLLVNPVTIGLTIYQITSFFVVYYYNSLNQKKEKSYIGKKESGRVKLQVQGSNHGRQNASIYPEMDFVSLMSELQNMPVYSTTLTSTKTSAIVGKVSQQCGSGHNPALGFHEKRQMILESAAKGRFYEDPEFPANHASLGKYQSGVVWKRPFEIVPGAQFFTNGVSRFDVRQGELGDCWFLAALANLTLNESLFSRVVPMDNEWKDKDYTGICHFNFFKNGKWEEVIIDDRLPTRAGKLIYMKSSDPNEFWSPLIEKAYAKFNGSYENLNGNDGSGRAMTNLTGGSVQRHVIRELGNNVQKLFDLMSTALVQGKMVGCCSPSMEGSGIYGNHAYSVTRVAKIQFKTGKTITCLRIRNPWGNGQEWSGKFSDGHPIWDLVEPKVKKQLQIKFKDDGEFWFPMQKLVKHFEYIEICQC